uniref:Uncharacterized protein n=1 Tax=viral metagenome TaxID=1070528 RepID=A0A6C0ENK8_9ZZZZ
MATILAKQRQMAMRQMQQRTDQKKAEIMAHANEIASRPPRPPMSPSPDTSKGIGFLPRRAVTIGRGKKHRVKKTRKNARRI